MYSHHHRRFAAKAVTVTPTPVFVNAASGTGITIPAPTGTQVGDQLLSYTATVGSDAFTPPSGWTEQADVNGVTFETKAATGTDGITWGSGSTAITGTMVRVLGGTFDSIGAYSTSSATMVAPSITMSAAGLILAFFWDATGGSATTYSTPAGMTLLTSQSLLGPAGVTTYIFYQYVSAGATGTRTSNSSGNPGRGALVGFIQT